MIPNGVPGQLRSEVISVSTNESRLFGWKRRILGKNHLKIKFLVFRQCLTVISQDFGDDERGLGDKPLQEIGGVVSGFLGSELDLDPARDPVDICSKSIF